VTQTRLPRATIPTRRATESEHSQPDDPSLPNARRQQVVVDTASVSYEGGHPHPNPKPRASLLLAITSI
jgi:hypothetical protein